MEEEILKSVDRKPKAVEEASDVPVYKMLGDTKIPVSSKFGQLWKSRWQQGYKKLETDGLSDLWEECVAYYKNDQTGRRNVVDGDRVDSGMISTENLVFANISAMLPSTYAKNPDVEITVKDEETYGEFFRVGEELINVLFKRDYAPGIGLKKKAKKCVVHVHLTNLAWIELGYVKKEQGTEKALEDLAKAAELLEQAKDQEEVKEAEGRLMALERKISFLTPSGPFSKFRKASDIIVDPDAECIEDAQWMICADYLSASYVQEVFGQKNEEGEWESVYMPTHLLKAKDVEGSIHEEIKNFTLLAADDKDHRNFGFEDDHSFRDAQRIKVHKVWDKVTLLEQAKDQEEVKEAEGRLMALERKISFLTPSGPFSKFRKASDIIVDPDAECIEDAQWMICADYLSASYVQEVFGQKNEEGEWESVYMPTHLLKAKDVEGSIHEEIKNFTLLAADDKDHRNFGFEDDHSFRDAQRIKVHKVWDKVTRRVYMFNEKDWSYPIWVWDDPYGLLEFFPFYPLELNIDPVDTFAKSEVAYYLDQQDEINEINSEKRRWRKNAIERWLYNSQVK